MSGGNWSFNGREINITPLNEAAINNEYEKKIQFVEICRGT